MAERSGGGGGGFVPPVLPTPSPSPGWSIASGGGGGGRSEAGSLPAPRERPLRAGSNKETSFIQYVDKGMLEITRRYAKKFTDAADSDAEGDGEVRGYESFREFAKDADALLDVVWVSGTPSLQTPYLLSLALLVVSYLPAFPPSPGPTFRILRRLDRAFASLLQGRDVSTGASLPGFESGRGVSPTEKVRMKSIVERTRVMVLEVVKGVEFPVDGDERDEDRQGQDTTAEDTTDDDEGREGMDIDEEEDDSIEMEIAKVYDQTLVTLGDTIGGSDS